MFSWEIFAERRGSVTVYADVNSNGEVTLAKPVLLWDTKEIETKSD